MSKSILIVTEYFYPEEFKINEIAQAWQEKGFKVDVLTQQPTYPHGKLYSGYTNKWFQKEQYQGLDIFRVKAVTGYRESLFKKLLKYFTFMIFGSLFSLRAGKKYDYVFGFDVGPLTGMVPAVILNKFYGKTVVLWIQDVWPDTVYAYGFKKNPLLEFFLNRFVRFVYRNSSALAVSGKGFISRVRPFTDASKRIEYLPNWSDELNTELPAFKFSQEDKFHFTFAGNVGTVQNLDNIILAFAELPDEYQHRVQFNIIGDGSYLPTLKKQVQDKQIKNVVFWGRKPRDEMYQYYAGSDVLIVSLLDKPVFNITVPAKLQTYIAAGRPILGVIKGDAAELICENKLGLCVSPDDIPAICNALKEYINADAVQLKQFSQNCERLTQETFNKQRIIDALLQMLTDK